MLVGELVELAAKLPAELPVYLHVETLVRLQEDEWDRGSSGYLDRDFTVERAELCWENPSDSGVSCLILTAGASL